MQLKYAVLFLLCLIMIFSASSCPVLASSSNKSEDFTTKPGTETEDDKEGHGGSGGQHGVVTDKVIFNNLIAPFQVIWNWCKTSKVFIGSHSFTFAEYYMFQILASIIMWFIWYKLYY